MGIEKRYISFRLGSTNPTLITRQEYVLMKTDFKQFFKLFQATLNGKTITTTFYWKYLWFKVLCTLSLFLLSLVAGYLEQPEVKNGLILLSLLAVIFVIMHPFSQTISFTSVTTNIAPEVIEKAKSYYRLHYKNIHKTINYDEYLKLMGVKKDGTDQEIAIA